jgi:hypothetical protein
VSGKSAKLSPRPERISMETSRNKSHFGVIVFLVVFMASIFMLLADQAAAR